MTSITVLRTLWRLRLAVAFVGLLALLAGAAVAYRVSFLPPKLDSRRYNAGTATVRILVDTPSSQVIDVAPKGSDTVAARALLLANLMVDGLVENEIAHRAGLTPQQLKTIGPPGADPGATTPVEPREGDNVLKTQVLTDSAGTLLPIIQVDAQEVTAEGASRLANAAVGGLRDYLGSQAAVEQIPEARRLRVDGLGAAQGGVLVRGPSRLAALLITILIFGVGCTLILVIDALARAWRIDEAEEALGPAAFDQDGALLDESFDEDGDVALPDDPDSEYVNGWGEVDWSSPTASPAKTTLYSAPAHDDSEER
jgi:hypothetical protein